MLLANQSVGASTRRGRFSIVFGLALLVIGACSSANAQVLTGIPEPAVYSNLPNSVPLNLFSQGPEAYGYTELGDGFTLAEKGTLYTVTVVLSSWACQSGSWQYPSGPNACVTTPGATYSMPVTVKIYSVVTGGTSLEGATGQLAPGTLLTEATQTFKMPYRPSSNFTNCPATAAESSGGYYQWYDALTQTCQDGIDFPITFSFDSKNVKLPNRIIVTFSFNTTHYGPNPQGMQACYGTTAGCFYDSLNISGGAGAAAFPGPTLAPFVGSVLNVNGIYTSFPNANTALCGVGTAPAETLALDASPGCYTGNHPMIAVTAY